MSRCGRAHRASPYLPHPISAESPRPPRSALPAPYPPLPYLLAAFGAPRHRAARRRGAARHPAGCRPPRGAALGAVGLPRPRGTEPSPRFAPPRHLGAPVAAAGAEPSGAHVAPAGSAPRPDRSPAVRGKPAAPVARRCRAGAARKSPGEPRGWPRLPPLRWLKRRPGPSAASQGLLRGICANPAQMPRKSRPSVRGWLTPAHSWPRNTCDIGFPKRHDLREWAGAQGGVHWSEDEAPGLGYSDFHFRYSPGSFK